MHSFENLEGFPEIEPTATAQQMAFLMDTQDVQRRILSEVRLTQKALSSLNSYRQQTLADAAIVQPVVYGSPPMTRATGAPEQHYAGICFLATLITDNGYQTIPVYAPVTSVEDGICHPISNDEVNYTDQEAQLIYHLADTLRDARQFDILPDLNDTLTHIKDMPDSR